MAVEIETKFKVPSPEGMRAKLARIGARFLSRELERDVYYVAPDSAGSLMIRLRARGERGLFTIKTAPAGGIASPAGLKVCEEVEVEVADADRFAVMLGMMGYVPRLRKEKVREAYEWREAKLFLDELPHLGHYLEIEADEAGIRAAAQALELDMSEASGESYVTLFSRFKTLQGSPDLELVFDRKAESGA